VCAVAVATLIVAVPAVAERGLEESFEEDEWWLPELDDDGEPVAPPNWLDFREIDAETSAIVEAYRADGLEVTIPAGSHRGSGALYLLPDGIEEAWFRYHIRLDDWDALDDGKLPGFADIGSSTARGCRPSTEEDPGWSARVLFHQPGTAGAAGNDVRLGYYTYHLDQPGVCGEFMPWSDAGIIEQDRWYCIEGRIEMNTPGSNDGELEAWVDGTKVFARKDLAFRRPGEEWVEVNTFWLNVFLGGDDVTNPDDLVLRFDQLVVDDARRVGCLTRFTDDDESAHEASIEFLFDEGIVNGCEQNLFCPYQKLTRAQLLVTLKRWLKPPPTSEDFFDDDDGHWAEADLNRLAAVGIVAGCGERQVCPDASVTRAQIASFLYRTLDLPDTATDYFVDDEGSVHEGPINALRGAGITSGCEPDRYCPGVASRRDQWATLLANTIMWADS
jgi:hypothetical protein